MQTNRPIQYVARIIVEARTPLSVSTGAPDGVFDTALVADANGLPALPGTAVAGVLRSLWREAFPQRENDALFGFQAAKDGQRSDVDVSWGLLLDSHGRAANGLLLGDDRKRLTNDPLFRYALGLAELPITRQRVRITARGAAADTGKFDRAVLPAGFRFAFEITLQASQPGDDTTWHALLDLLAHPALRIGGGTRAGLGALRTISVHQACFDRAQPDSAAAWCCLERALDRHEGLVPYTPKAGTTRWLAGVLHLTPTGPWRVGQGHREVGELQGRLSAKPADLLQVLEPRVVWQNGVGTLEAAKPQILLPATTVKGVLAHRVTFHANRFAGRWAAAGSEDPPVPERDALFGAIKDKQGGQAGCLLLDDVLIEPNAVQPKQVMHNSIDRFTGGVRNRVLFCEESLWGGEFAIPVALDITRLEATGCARETRHALRAALDDLCHARLPFGSRTSTGNGFATGHLGGALAEWLAADTVEQERAA